ncbi:ABC transporter permease [Actinophytocola xinjiangensis]|uniref:ABC transporter permease n=1 Tax=Actinophytocola xinjiangensis TaxID=485602 RepID=A0A7Z0WLJ3_9PSEU|nr:iron chelate uptake ABC transporter family permease subunit [Actinophytocola xinjiangensis]OLF09808.1 ABC transporter permease [Actinophytocola xinjiangensis]
MTPAPAPASAEVSADPGVRRWWRWGGLVAVLGVLVLVCLLSIAVGSRTLPLATVWDLLWHDDGGEDAFAIHDVRVPRTVLGLLSGAALGLAGALMQALARNPLADPGLLGVNHGASAAVVVAISLFGVSAPGGYVWFAIAGAGAASVIVYLLGAGGRPGTPDRLVLAGLAIGAALAAFVSAVLFLDPQSFDAFRFWEVGSLTGRKVDVVWQVGPFLAVGIVVALALARPLNAMGLGTDVARSLGVHVTRTQTAAALSVALLCGAATAAVGPIVFVGLAVPHLARLVTGPDQRWVLSYSLVIGPVLLIAADVLGRVVARPGELEVGIVTAVLGAPALLLLARRRRIATP